MIKPKEQKKARKPIIVPYTMISNSKKTIHIICQLQGVAEEKIRIDLEQGQLNIAAANNTREFIKKITVPDGSQISSKKFHEGILEILLDRPS
ncbi:MAG: hypothetical protein ABSG06_04065 [Methanoregula sp.]|jgi:HSP20 family molecular chaperone IbpA